ncbi:hypothetical protein CEE36_07140 [candidate division TA06 bacterium B3_TA06]|uniref:Putative zinc-finger domain-containing protein n=1 Tax=candidate division TA06 bacterium B3_TA06 TaxID=2012487 RepID=A0A532V651_UNCT6|nr:MAG: hypothetical protein CEE36_07140 [candidate division TA06 bacterium B3_TA06]
MNCKGIEELLQAYHDGELSEAQRKEVESHLAKCPKCQAKLAELGALDELLIDGDAERVPDPGKHYWHSFSHRVTRRLIPRREAIIRPHRPRPLGFRLLPYLSAAVAVFLAIVISIPFLKRAPAKFTEEEIAEITAPPKKSDVSFKRFEGEPEAQKIELRDKKLVSTDETLGAESVETGGESPLATMPSEADMATKGAGTVATEREPAPEALRTERMLRKDEKPKPSAVAKTAEPYLEEAEVFADQVLPQQGTLRVVIDSTGQLAKVTIEKSSGDPKADTMAMKAYKNQWEGKTFRERQRTLLVPFSPQSAE